MTTTNEQAWKAGGPELSLIGRDEMNLVEIPLGPITGSTGTTLEVNHEVYDRRTRRFVERRLVVTASEKYGLPRPIDDQVAVGLIALTCEAGFCSPEVWFSRYHLCRTLGWPPDGRAYQRI